MIASSVGLVPIEDIKSGDKVWATNPETGETVLKEVVQTFRNEANELVHVTVNGEEIICTPTHPFYVPVKGWTASCELRAGDRLQLVNGEYVVVEQVQHEILESPVTVYNFEVADFHTYYVGDTRVLVHNKCKPDSPVKVDPKTLKDVDVHAFKGEFVRKNVAHWDVFKDTANNSSLWLGNKAQNKWIETGYFLKDIFKFFLK